MKSKNIEDQVVHKPVLIKEVLNILGIHKLAHLKSKARYIDATLGAGGHTIGLLKNNAYVLGIDDDESMLSIARKNISLACPAVVNDNEKRFISLQGNFKDIDQLARSVGFCDIDGVIFDLGISSYHFDLDNRGFTFSDRNQPLDMRLNTKVQGVLAADLLNSLSKSQLVELFLTVLTKGQSNRLADSIIKYRLTQRILNVGDLLDVLSKCGLENKKNNVATLPFLALRMVVNSELLNLREALPKAFSLLNKGGRLLVISFHSGEDKVVKKYFLSLYTNGLGKLITKKAITPFVSEISDNPRSRSAKLRFIEKV